MEFIVRLFRSLANRERIRILRLLSVFEEMNVSEIADAIEVVLTAVSGHLKVLAAAGVVWRRRSGRVVNYRLAEHAGNMVTGTALRIVRQTFSKVAADDPRKVVRADRSDSHTDSDAALFACFTAFTHPRRLQIIRHLVSEGEAAHRELTAKLSMSQRACHRHLGKLERRQFVCSGHDQGRAAYTLTHPEGKAQRLLLRAVCDYLQRDAQ